MGKIEFVQAKPLWAAGREKEMNLTMGFSAVIGQGEGRKAVLRLTASTIYRCMVNCHFIGHGPARGPHGFYRVDEYDLSPFLTLEQNIISIEVSGANINSYYVLNQPSFLQAEVALDDKIALATMPQGSGGFKAFILPERVQRVQRYMYQRTFAEYYRMKADSDFWKSKAGYSLHNVECAESETKRLIVRGVSYPGFAVRLAERVQSEGRMERQKQETYWRPETGGDLLGYSFQQMEVVISDELQELRTVEQLSLQISGPQPFQLVSTAFRTVDLGINLTGFIRAKVTCYQPSKVYFLFDEILDSKEDINPLRSHSVNAVGYELSPGEYDLESMEPYTFRYLKVVMVEGDCRFEDLGIREHSNPDTDRATFSCSNESLNKIFEAARETFKQNTTDIYMDCPSRERAGWLCDSFFTSRVEQWLTGASIVERNFIENFLLPEKFDAIPEGVLPMCYPADLQWQPLGNIPNWGLWFVLQLEEYVKRTGDYILTGAIKPRIYRLLRYFKSFENADGLLERLEGWVFVEWSKANDLVQDVNYPMNMLYAGALDAAGRLFEDADLIEQAERIRLVIREQSFNGEFFVDNAVRVNGRLTPSGETTEVSQYYAFTFQVANPSTHPDLWKVLLQKFGPARDAKLTYPKVYPANAFIGNYLRLDLLSQYGEGLQLLREIEEYFLYMANETGTLWEHKDTSASLNHGFASHVIHWLYKEALGICRIDHSTRNIEVEIKSTELEHCEATIPVADGQVVHLRWWKEGGTLRYSLMPPPSYQVVVRKSE